MKGKLTGRGRKKSSDFPFNFYIIDFREGFWQEKNVRLGREFN